MYGTGGSLLPPWRGHGQEEEKGGIFRDGLEAEREARGRPVMENATMASAVQKISLSPSRDIPFNKLC